MASSSSSSRQMNHQVFLSFRGEDTRLNFTAHLLKALKGKGLDVFFDEESLEKGKKFTPALSQAIAASRLSIIILSSDYASSKSCLAEVSYIMDRKRTAGHFVLPIFYHVDASKVRNIGGSFKTSFDNHESKGLDQVQRWKAAFAAVGKLEGRHIGGEFDRPETEHIKDIVDYVILKLMKHQVFLSFRGEDTGLNFTAHLLKASADRGINVFSDKGEQFSQAISVSNISIIVLSVHYASSQSCLAELYEIMDRKDSQGQIVLPIFYHVDPSDVRKIGGSFKTSFDGHESNDPRQVQQWKKAFAQAGELKGWHIEGGKFDRPDSEYIKDVIEYVIKRLNSKSTSVSEDLVGIDDQKKVIVGLVEQEDSRVVGLLGMGGIGKTTLADAVYNEISPKFQSRCFLQNVREGIKNKGMVSLRNELLSKLLDDKIEIDTPSIGSDFIQERLNNKRVIVVFDDVDDSDQIDCMGIEHFGDGCKIIVTSRNRQVLKNGGANKIHMVKKLNWIDSLQLFSKFAFKVLNPAVEFLDLSYKFVDYAQGSPLALKVLGSKLYSKSRKEWESEVDRLKQYGQPKISQILKSSFDGLDELEKSIFLDIACFFKGEPMDDVEKILSSYYTGAVCGISNLIDKCLLETIDSQFIAMHDVLEEMGKDIVDRESKDRGKRSRLWNSNDVHQVLKHNKGTDRIEGIKLDMSKIDNLRLRPYVFENMINLRYIHFYDPLFWNRNKKLHADGVDSVSLPDELRYICWQNYPFKSLPSNFNTKNLVVLRLRGSHMEQLWNEDANMDIVNLRVIDVSDCKNLRKIPNLSGAVNLKSLNCQRSESLVQIPCLRHLTSLKEFNLEGCYEFKKFPELPINFSVLDLSFTGIEEVPDSIEHLLRLGTLNLSCSKVKNVSSNISKLKSLRSIDLSYCPVVEFPEIPLSLTRLDLSWTEIEEVSLSFDSLSNLQYLNLRGSSIQKLRCNIALSGSREIPTIDAPSPVLRSKSLGCLEVDFCFSLELLSGLPPYMRELHARQCMDLEKVSFADQNLYKFDSSDYYDDDDCGEFLMLFSECISLNRDSIDNIEANAMLKIGFLAKTWIAAGKYACYLRRLICCFPGYNISANKFKYQSNNSRLNLKIDPNGYTGGRFLAFAICLVADLTQYCHRREDLEFICEYQLTSASGDCYEKFRSEFSYELVSEKGPTYIGDHVLVLFSEDMIQEDKNYEEASFEFYIKYSYYNDEEEDKPEFDEIIVDQCGVHVFYVDAERDTNSDWMSNNETSQSFSSREDANIEEDGIESRESFNSDEMRNDESDQEDANIEKIHDNSAAEIRRAVYKRSFIYDGEEGHKRMK
ncbi:hypothetical protein F3Y22_tig00110021pilonHSYRG00014 [Hibiscus syriacus]|uniref:ADP-ribosyl cyclase/cyclic ADP-ribose hydrolase n=1 Tax=Hibiscus syriacus TaxID=106335 RepID=A0A6A3BQP1_HIBSY|nr:TMV resistance protein N-like [Hibiscus syriacus]KAE8717738.1 hypothetical protein F3Y22_tig00110021pilonHSYRG00014 [Hibiscus syriacus]